MQCLNNGVKDKRRLLMIKITEKGIAKNIALRCLEQYLAFKNGLNHTEMVGWKKTDKHKVQTCQYWLESYLNGLKLMQEARKYENNDN